jgi:hypothetical protein
LFINGNLVSTKILPSVVDIKDINTSIVLGQENNNFLGKIKNLMLYPYPLSYDEISSIASNDLTTKRSCDNNCDKIL